MAQNQVEIEVVLDAKKAEAGLNKVAKGAEGVGESFSTMGKVVTSTGGQINQNLGKIGEAAGDSVTAFAKLGTAAKTAGASFSSMLGPIGLAVMAVAELVQAYREYNLEASGVNLRVEAYKAAAAELTSILEQLADAQVKLNEEQIKAFRIQTMAAQQDLEEAQLKREKSAEIYKEIQLIEQRIKQQKQLVSVAKQAAATAQGGLLGGGGLDPSGIPTETPAMRAAVAVAELGKLEQRQAELLKKQTQMLAEADKLAVQGAEKRQKVQAQLEETLKQSPEFIKKIKDTEAKLGEEARMAELERTKDTVDTQIEIARIGAERKIRELKAIEDISEQVRSRSIAAERSRLEAQISSIQREAAKKRDEEWRARASQRKADLERQRLAELALERQTQAEIRTLRQLELQQMQADGVSALEILKLRYNDEIALAGENINQMLIAQARFDLEKTKLDQQAEAERIASIQRVTEAAKKNEEERLKAAQESTKKQMELVTQLSERYGTGLAEAAYNSAILGESFSDAIGKSLVALGKQFAVQALGQTAEGIAALFLNPALAANKFAAAGAFATAAAAAGVAGTSLGGGSGGGGSTASAASTSPTGIAQTTTTPERERAETQQTVFNINFSGAVIYDTQRAAEQALADRITNLQNRQRRGGPRRLPNA
jgi:hypothetical protein